MFVLHREGNFQPWHVFFPDSDTTKKISLLQETQIHKGRERRKLLSRVQMNEDVEACMKYQT